MMEENDFTFLASGDALVYLTESMPQKYSTTFVWAYQSPICVRT